MKMRNICAIIILLAALTVSAQTIINGVPWYDQNGKVVNAHGANIIRDGNKWWMFGEYKSDTTNCFPGFGCYSSTDLSSWKFERVVLPVQKSGLLGPNRVGERPKVQKCPKTGLYVMLMHADSTNYNDQYTCLAACSSINGDYKFLGPLKYKGEPIRNWDLGFFKDDDGRAYLIAIGGKIYRLSDDYLSADSIVAQLRGMGESPAIFKKNGIYYLLTSHLTSWERNDNYYFTATSMSGPWKKHGLFCPEGTLTWNSQTSYVLMLPDGTPMYMGDRWSYPHQSSCATQIWLPLHADGEQLSIPEYWQVWDLGKKRPADILSKAKSKRTVGFKSDMKGKSISVKFRGRQVAFTGKTNMFSGYGRVYVTDMKGKTVYESYIDFYSMVPASGILCLTPRFPYGRYRLNISVTGEKPNWSDKRKNDYGSKGYEIEVDDVYIIE
jgi:hypothetical protein